MIASHEVDFLSTSLKVFETYRAVLHQSIFNAHMVLLHRQHVAHIAAITVVSVLGTAILAHAALITVKDLFLLHFIVV